MTGVRVAVTTVCAALAALVTAATVSAPREFSHLALVTRPLPLYPLDAALAIVLLGAAIAWRDPATRDDRRSLNRLALPAALWLAWGLVCAARGAAAGEPLRSLRDLAMNGYPLAAVAGAWLAAKGVGPAFLAGCGLLALKGFTQAAAGRDIFPELPGYAPLIGRYLHGAEAAFACIGSVGLLAGDARRLPVFRIAAAGVLLAVAVLAQQRSVFLAWAAALAVAGALHPRPLAMLARAACAGLVAVAAGAAATSWLTVHAPARPAPFGLFAAKFSRLAAAPRVDTTVEFRRQAWSEALRRWHAAPLTGEGYGRPFGFAYAAATTSDPAMHAGSLALARHADIRPHNTYLTILYKSGLVGLALFTWLIVRSGAAAWSGQRVAPAGSRRLGAAGGVILLAAFGAVNLMLESPSLAVPFWGMIGMLIARPRRPARTRRRLRDG